MPEGTVGRFSHASWEMRSEPKSRTASHHLLSHLLDMRIKHVDVCFWATVKTVSSVNASPRLLLWLTSVTHIAHFLWKQLHSHMRTHIIHTVLPHVQTHTLTRRCAHLCRWKVDAVNSFASNTTAPHLSAQAKPPMSESDTLFAFEVPACTSTSKDQTPRHTNTHPTLRSYLDSWLHTSLNSMPLREHKQFQTYLLWEFCVVGSKSDSFWCPPVFTYMAHGKKWKHAAHFESRDAGLCRMYLDRNDILLKIIVILL